MFPGWIIMLLNNQMYHTFNIIFSIEEYSIFTFKTPWWHHWWGIKKEGKNTTLSFTPINTWEYDSTEVVSFADLVNEVSLGLPPARRLNNSSCSPCIKLVVTSSRYRHWPNINLSLLTTRFTSVSALIYKKC